MHYVLLLGLVVVVATASESVDSRPVLSEHRHHRHVSDSRALVPVETGLERERASCSHCLPIIQPRIPLRGLEYARDECRG